MLYMQSSTSTSIRLYALFRIDIIYALFKIDIIYALFKIDIMYALFKIDIIYALFRIDNIYALFEPTTMAPINCKCTTYIGDTWPRPLTFRAVHCHLSMILIERPI